MNHDEENLLLYFETCLVDNRGKVTGRRMNEIDFDIAKKWKKDGFIEFERIPFHDIDKTKAIPNTHTVRFSDKAWGIAFKLRRERAERHVKTVHTIGVKE